jgi:outer membrane protein assembly factor BamB
MSLLLPNNPWNPTQDVGRAAARAWRMTAWTAAGFVFLLGLFLILGHESGRAEDPLKSPELKALKEQLRSNPTDEQLKTRIRALDLQLRQHYFRQISRLHSGVFLLLGGLAIFVVAAARAGLFPRPLPMPQPRPNAAAEVARASTLAQWSVAASGAGIGLFLLILGLNFSPALPGRLAELEKLSGGSNADTITVPDAAAQAELNQNWPRFRGPAASGFSPATNLPAAWDVKTGNGILWKTAVPAPGFNSPIVWGNRVFFSGGNAAKREVFCIDAFTGNLLWRRPVATAPAGQKPEIPESTGYAAASMAADGRRVYVFFANGDLAGFSLEGKSLWTKSFGTLKNPYGHATSVITWRDHVLLQLDQGEPEENKSKLYALDGRTGQVIWQQPRKVGSSWATPMVIEAADKAQVITLAVPWIIAYSTADGAELWRVEGLNGEITPSPAFAGGLVIAASPSEKLFAIRPDGHGDVTKTHIVWSTDENVPDVTSPTGNDDLVFTLTTSGTLTCLDVKDGKKQWEHDFDMECHASPSIAGDRVYIFGQKGAAIVVQAARQFKELFRTEMADGFHASPAFAQDKIFLRGVTNVWCLSQAKSENRTPKAEIQSK